MRWLVAWINYRVVRWWIRHYARWLKRYSPVVRIEDAARMGGQDIPAYRKGWSR